MLISCSTCWNSHRHRSGDSMLEEIESLGFQWVELSHGIRISLLDTLLPWLDKGRLKVSSLHNFCPLPLEVLVDNPDCLQFSSPHLAERRRAVRVTLETIDFAVRTRTPLIVLHLGGSLPGTEERQLRALYREGRIHAPAAVRLRLALLQRIQIENALLMPRVLEALDQIVPYAARNGIQLGIECRSGLTELPDEDGFDALWKRYSAATVGYWHDFGHMERKQHLGFANHWERLSSRAGRLIGSHVHDVIAPAHDHEPVGTGTIPYAQLLPALPCHIPWVLEHHRGNSAGDLVSSAREFGALYKKAFGVDLQGVPA